MARTRQQRRRKHRGTQSGSIDRRGRARPRSRAEARSRARSQATQRRDKPPSWSSAVTRALFAAGIFFLLLVLALGRPVLPSLALCLFMLLIYVPFGYYTDRFFYRRRLRQRQRERERAGAK